MALEFGYLELVNGIFSIAIICSFAFVGYNIAKIYRKSKEKVYLLVGIAWILLASPWYGSGTSFIVALFNYGQGLSVLPLLYFSLVVLLIPIALATFVTSITEIIYREYRWSIRSIFIVFGILMEILFIYMMISTPTDVITLLTAVNAHYSTVVLIYILISLVILVIIGILLGRSSIKIGTTENKLKGYFVLAAFTLYALGAIFDSLLNTVIKQIPVLILLPRGFLLLSAFCFYLGFVTPNFIKKRLKLE